MQDRFLSAARRMILYGVIALPMASPVRAQFSYPNCADPKAADFQMTELFNRKGTSGATADPTLSEPTRMDIRSVVKSDGTFDHADIIFVERYGNVKFYDGVAKTVKVMGKINTLGQADNALMGVAYDPHFDKNRWIYLWYSPKQMIGQNRQLRLTRMTVKADNTLDMASEKILINILGSKSDNWHSGGPMQFDSYGDLWVGVGNNSPDLDPTQCDAGGSVLSKTDSTQSAEWGPSNTHSLRGGFFRIHPDSSAKGYSVPHGNFGEYWADQFDKQGNSALAAQYRDTSKVLPEVYVKGERSNFSIAVHPTKRWLAWGTVNYASVNDEFNIASHPEFTGYPYFHNNNLPTCNHGKDVNAPTNNSPFNSGVTTLPPAVPGAINNLVNVAIGGALYDYDQSLNSKDKFPPGFDNKWLISGFFVNKLWMVTFDTTTMKVTNTTEVDGGTGIFSGFQVRNHVMSKYGQDGALYILNYDGYYDQAVNPGVMRIAYKGNCTLPLTTSARPRGEPYMRVYLSTASLRILDDGPHEFGLYDPAGKRVFAAQGGPGAEYRFDAIRAALSLKAGVYLARVQTTQGSWMRAVSLF